MSFLEWKDRMSVGNPSIDHDHQKLVRYVNEMHDAMMAGHGKDVVGPILHKLVAYTKEHFAREEAVWRAGHYVEFARHKKQHEDLLHTVGDFQAKYNAGAVALSVEVMNFLRDWLKTHILRSDKEAADAIAATAAAHAPKPAAFPMPH